jgi:hypothetical protein
MSTYAGESGIPILTEVIGAPVYGIDLPERRNTPDLSESVGSSTVLSVAQTAALTTEISERVLNHLLGHVDEMLDAHIQDGLASAMQDAVGQLAAHLRIGLQHSLGSVVTMAVAEELQNLQRSKNKENFE